MRKPKAAIIFGVGVLTLTLLSATFWGGRVFLGYIERTQEAANKQRMVEEERQQQAKDAAVKAKRHDAAMALSVTTIGGGQTVPKANPRADMRSASKPQSTGDLTIVTLNDAKPSASTINNAGTGSPTAPAVVNISPSSIQPDTTGIITLNGLKSTAIKPYFTTTSLGKPAARTELMLSTVTNTNTPATAINLPQVSVEGLRKELSPPLEEERAKEEKLLTADQDTVKIVTGFECSTPLDVEKISPTHFAVRITTDSTLKNWFMFRIEGAKGKTVRIDIKDAPLQRWWSLNPVYSYVTSLDDLSSFATKPVTNPVPTKAYNGPMLPDTSGQPWQYISNVWSEHQTNGGAFTGTYCFVQHFDSDGVYLAMKTPFTPHYELSLATSLRSEPDILVTEIGKSREGRPLLVVQIGSSDPAKTPCIVLYAREHADEQDGSWVAQGAIDRLLLSDDATKQLRQQFTFLIIPMLDPDGAAASKYEVITHQFVYDGKSGPEALAFAGFFRKWIEDGKRLDVVFNIHNVESAENGHIWSVVKEGRPLRAQASWDLDEGFLRPLMTTAGFNMDPRKQKTGDIARFRLGGYLAFFYGPLHMPYEVNSEEKSRHLALSEINGIGAMLINAATGYLRSEKSASFESLVAAARSERNGRVKQFSDLQSGESNALRVEWISYQRTDPLLRGN